MNQLVEKILQISHDIWKEQTKTRTNYNCPSENWDWFSNGGECKKFHTDIAKQYLDTISISELIQYKAEQSLPEGYEMCDYENAYLI